APEAFLPEEEILAAAPAPRRVGAATLPARDVAQQEAKPLLSDEPSRWEPLIAPAAPEPPVPARPALSESAAPIASEQLPSVETPEPRQPQDPESETVPITYFQPLIVEAHRPAEGAPPLRIPALRGAGVPANLRRDGRRPAAQPAPERDEIEI